MRAEKDHLPEMAVLVKEIWPEHSLQDLERILSDYMDGAESAAFTAFRAGGLAGITLCALRHDYVEGCDSSPVGYLEGIVVDERFRHQGLAKALCKECEDWARSMGCREFGSDCELTNSASLAFHLNIGFTEENRIICFKKNL